VGTCEYNMRSFHLYYKTWDHLSCVCHLSSLILMRDLSLLDSHKEDHIKPQPFEGSQP